ncbi:DUF6264 family protein [Microbacterium immunditiarum]
MGGSRAPTEVARYDAAMTQPPPYGPPASPIAPYQPAPAAKPPARVWDVVLTVVLLVGLGVLALIVSFFGFFLAMASDPCGVRDCSTELIGLGMLTAVALPWAVLLAAVVLAIVLLVRRRHAFWVPLVAVPFVIGSWFVGAFIAAAGVPTG